MFTVFELLSNVIVAMDTEGNVPGLVCHHGRISMKSNVTPGKRKLHVQ